MKSKTFINVILYVSLLTLSGCGIVQGIFNAGMGVGIFIVVLVIALIIYLIAKIRKF